MPLHKLSTLTSFSAFLLLMPAMHAQETTVTFYSVGSVGKAILQSEMTLGVRSHPPFNGFVFDGDNRLGLLQAGHFMTLNLPAGDHTFAPGSAWSIKKPSDKVTLALKMEPGQHYFVEMTQTNKGFYAVQIPFVNMTQVECQAAVEKTQKAKPVIPKRVEKAYQTNFVASAPFPACSNE